MRYYKTFQPVPGKGDAYMYYECNDDMSVRRYLTHIPVTGEITKVPNPFVKSVQNPDALMDATAEEFLRLWPEDFVDKQEAVREAIQENYEKTGTKHFDIDMTVGAAMAMHPRVADVFAAFHLGGCASCGISGIETIGQVCLGYGVDVDVLLDVLEGLMTEEENGAEASAP